MRVTVTKAQGENGYVVKANLPKHELKLTKVFLWGSFDEGDVSWQSARAQAHRYAADLRNRPNPT